MKDDKLSITQYKTYYAVIDHGDGRRCAWCERLLSEFKNENDHLVAEDIFNVLEDSFRGEELLYRDFIKIKDKILRGGEK